MEKLLHKNGRREGALLWLVKIIAGLFIVIVLGIHLVVNHLVAPGGLLTYSDVLNYYRLPFIPLMEIAFLVLAVVHSLLGLRSILLDLNPAPTLQHLADVALIVVGGSAILYGSWLVIFLSSK